MNGDIPYPGQTRYRLFAFFFALQTLSGISQSWPDPIRVPLLIPAALLLCNTTSVGLLLLIAVSQIALAASKMPNVGNHYLLQAVVNLMLLASFLHLAAKRRFNKEAWLDEITPPARLIILIVYFFAFFHKLNRGFLNPDISCATFMYGITVSKLHLALSGQPQGLLAHSLIYSVLLAELAIPLLLVFPVTRRYGLLIGIVFHAVLGLILHTFSTFVYTMYLLFLPESFFLRASAWWAKHVRDRHGYASWMIPLFLLTIFYLFFFVSTALTIQAWESPLREYWPLAWLLLSLALLLLCAYFLFSGTGAPPTERPIATWKPLWTFSILIIFNGLLPYAGLKTGNSFDMFSNLITEGGVSNHLIIPKGSLQLFDYQDDLVTVTGANQPAFYPLIRDNLPIPYLELRRKVENLAHQGVHNIHLTFVRNGEQVEVARAEEDPDLSKPLAWYERKFIFFKENLMLSPTREDKCSW